jgi:predicted aspartyl protease
LLHGGKATCGIKRLVDAKRTAHQNTMSFFTAAAIAAALSSATSLATPAAVFGPTVPPATIDNSLEVVGESLAAEQRRSRLFVDVKVNGRGPYRFLVDSGADRSVIGAALAERLDLPREAVVRVRGMAGTSDASSVRIDMLDIGSSRIETILAPALPEKFIGAQGIIGIDALADQRLLLDFENKTVVIQDTRRPQIVEEGEIVVTARRRKGQLILTQVSVDGDRTYAVIDTGSELTMGNSAMLKRIMRGRRLPPMQTVTLISVTGESLDAQVALVAELRIGGVLMENVQIAFTDAPPFELFGLDKQPALLLGTDLLKSFRRLSLDFRNRKVRFVLRR